VGKGYIHMCEDVILHLCPECDNPVNIG